MIPSPRPLALVVEDDFDIAQIVTISLASVGYQIELIKDGQQAIDWLETHTPLLVVLDLNLPSRNGTDIYTFMRSFTRLRQTWVILNTANAVQADQIAQIDDAYLFSFIKPVSVSQLRQIGQRLLPQ